MTYILFGHHKGNWVDQFNLTSLVRIVILYACKSRSKTEVSIYKVQPNIYNKCYLDKVDY